MKHAEAIHELEILASSLDFMTMPNQHTITEFSANENKRKAAELRESIEALMDALVADADVAPTEPRFAPGDRVAKVGGSYQATGVIKAAWLADDGTARYVFRFDSPAGMLHIFSDANLVGEGDCNE